MGSKLPKRKPNRLKGYDYSNAGAYFVTICSADYKNSFGKVSGNTAELSSLGKIANTCWQDIPQHFPNVTLSEYVIMPNHVHGVLLISIGQKDAEFASKSANDNTLGAVIGQFKSSVTRTARNAGIKIDKLWQRGFYDRVIRNEEDMLRVREYILQNPLALAIDKRTGDPWVAPTNELQHSQIEGYNTNVRQTEEN